MFYGNFFAFLFSFIVHHQINSSCWICWESQKLHRFTLQREHETLLLLSQWKWLFIPSPALLSHCAPQSWKLRIKWQKASFCLQNLCDLSLFLHFHSQITNCSVCCTNSQKWKNFCPHHRHLSWWNLHTDAAMGAQEKMTELTVW